MLIFPSYHFFGNERWACITVSVFVLFGLAQERLT